MWSLFSPKKPSIHETMKPLENRLIGIENELAQTGTDEPDPTVIDQLMELTDGTTSWLLRRYEDFEDANRGQVFVMATSIVTAAIYLSEKTSHNAAAIADRYLGECADKAVRPPKEVNSPALKRQLLDAAKTNFMFVARTGLAPDNIAAIKFVGGLDNLAGVSRSEIDREVTATVFKTTIRETFKAVDRLDL